MHALYIAYDFAGSDLRDAHMTGVFVDCDFRGADLRGATLVGSFTACDFRGARWRSLFKRARWSGSFVDCVFDEEDNR